MTPLVIHHHNSHKPVQYSPPAGCLMDTHPLQPLRSRDAPSPFPRRNNPRGDGVPCWPGHASQRAATMRAGEAGSREGSRHPRLGALEPLREPHSCAISSWLIVSEKCDLGSGTGQASAHEPHRCSCARLCPRPRPRAGGVSVFRDGNHANKMDSSLSLNI